MAGKKRIATLLTSDFEDSELRVPLEKFREAGFEVDLISTKAGEELVGKKGEMKVRATRGIDDARAEDYDELFIPGGFSPDKLRADSRFVEFVRRFDATKKPVAAV